MYNLIRTLSAMCLVLCLHQSTFARINNGNGDSSTVNTNNPHPDPIDANRYRTFPSLNGYFPKTGTALTNIPLDVAYGKPEFTPDYLAKNFTVSEFMSDARGQAVATIEEVERQNRYTDFLSPNDLTELPIGIKKKLGTSTVIIGVSKAVFKTDFAVLTVFCKILIPQGDPIFFGAEDIQLSYRGGILGTNAKLVLLGDYPISINGGNMMITLKGGFDMKTGNIAPDMTSAKFSCGGIQSLNIAADVSFPRSLLVPLDEQFKPLADESKKVVGEIRGREIQSWDELIVGINLPSKFALRGVE